MSVFSYYCRNKLFNCLLGMDTFDKPETFIGLSTTDPSTGSPTEPTASDYNRVLFGHWDIVGNRKVQNHTTISFYTRSAWGTVGWYILWDSMQGGNFLGYGALNTPMVIDNRRVASFSRNQISFQFESGCITDYLANRFMDHIFGISTLMPVTSYVGLSYINPGNSGKIVKPLNPEYHDVEFSDWDVSDISELSNLSLINFPNPTSFWGILPYVFLRDGENRTLLSATLDQPIVADTYNPISLIPNALTFIFD